MLKKKNFLITKKEFPIKKKEFPNEKKEFTQYSKKKNFLIKKKNFQVKKKEKKKKIISSFPFFLTYYLLTIASLIARKSALEKTQLSDVLITHNLF